MLFAVKLGWFPIGFSAPIGVLEKDVTIINRMYHMILPAITLAFVGIANIALHTREKVIDIMNSDYILFARARGLKGFSLITKKKTACWTGKPKTPLLPKRTIR